MKGVDEVKPRVVEALKQAGTPMTLRELMRAASLAAKPIPYNSPLYCISVYVAVLKDLESEGLISVRPDLTRRYHRKIIELKEPVCGSNLIPCTPDKQLLPEGVCGVGSRV